MARRLGVDLRITRLLLQVGVMCARLERYEVAEKIIRSVKAFRDDLPHPGTALATAFLFQKRLQEAAAELESVLLVYPNHQLGKAFLGLVYRESEREGWRTLLEEVIEDGRDESAIELARHCLHGDDSDPARSAAPEQPERGQLIAPNLYA
jgi:Bacterial type III secretion protein (HrpB1_HrpK)